MELWTGSTDCPGSPQIFSVSGTLAAVGVDLLVLFSRLKCMCVSMCAFRQEFNSEASPDLQKEVYLQDIHCVGSLCKLYFRELPNPLLTYELYSKFTVSPTQIIRTWLSVHALTLKKKKEFSLCHFILKITLLFPNHLWWLGLWKMIYFHVKWNWRARVVKEWLKISTFSLREKLKPHLLDMKETLEKSRGKANTYQL